jgi:hypothetical protein
MNKGCVTAVVLGLVLILVIVGVNPKTWTLFEADIDKKTPTKVLIAADLKELQESETIAITFYYTQGVNKVQAGNRTLHLDHNQPRLDAVVDLAGSGQYTYTIQSTTVLNIRGVRIPGTGSGQGTLQIKGETKLQYGIDDSGCRPVRNVDGTWQLSSYKPFLQPPGQAGGERHFDTDSLQKAMAEPESSGVGTVVISNRAPILPTVVAFVYVDGVSVQQWPVRQDHVELTVKAGKHEIEVRREKPNPEVVARFSVTVRAGQKETLKMDR